MHTEQLALVRGWADTRATLARWHRAPAAVVVPWTRLAFAIAVAMLTATWVVALVTEPDPWAGAFTPRSSGATVAYADILVRNGLVLALHAMACVAGFIAGSSLPVAAQGYRGIWGALHRKAGPSAIAFVVAATLFSLVTQVHALGTTTSALAADARVSPGFFLLLLAPHAVPELVALFLPLAAWIVASRRGRWEELLAATFVTVALAVPLLLASAVVEVWVSPRLFSYYTF